LTEGGEGGKTKKTPNGHISLNKPRRRQLSIEKTGKKAEGAQKNEGEERLSRKSAMTLRKTAQPLREKKKKIESSWQDKKSAGL